VTSTEKNLAVNQLKTVEIQWECNCWNDTLPTLQWNCM